MPYNTEKFQEDIDMRRFLKWIQLILMLILPMCAFAQEEVRMDLQVNLFMKILRYDRNISNRGEKGLKIGILYNPSSKLSTKMKEDFEEEFKLMKDNTINGIQVFIVPIKGVGELSKAIQNYGVNILYIARGFDNELDDILDICKKDSVLTLTGVPKYAERGVAVGLGIKMNRPQIIINTKVAKEVGAKFSADILKLAKVIK